jgi:hypothetical protein
VAVLQPDGVGVAEPPPMIPPMIDSIGLGPAVEEDVGDAVGVEADWVVAGVGVCVGLAEALDPPGSGSGSPEDADEVEVGVGDADVVAAGVADAVAELVADGVADAEPHGSAARAAEPPPEDAKGRTTTRPTTSAPPVAMAPARSVRDAMSDPSGFGGVLGARRRVVIRDVPG